jgi:hypothetical protein
MPNRSLPAGLGFAICQQVRQSARPNRVRNRYGLVVHFRLLSTPFHKDAVTFRFRPENVCLKRTCTSLTKHNYRRTATGGPRQCGAADKAFVSIAEDEAADGSKHTDRPASAIRENPCYIRALCHCFVEPRQPTDADGSAKGSVRCFYRFYGFEL